MPDLVCGDFDNVVLTVFVTPVGKVVIVTELVPATDRLPVLDHTDVLETDMDTDPVRLDVFDCVVEAVTVFVDWTEPEFFMEEEPQGHADGVFEVRPDLVCVTETVDVLDAEVEAVVVVETVVVLVGKLDVDEIGVSETWGDPVELHVFVIVDRGALDPVTVMVTVLVPMMVRVVDPEEVGVLEVNSEPVAV